MAKKDKPQSEEEAAASTVEVASMAEAMTDYDAYVQSRAEAIWNNDHLPFDLSLEQQLFVRSYIIDRNEIAALKRLGHLAADPTLKNRAKKMMASSEVQGAIEHLAKELMAKLEVTAEKVQRRIASVAFFDPRQVMEFDRFGVQVLNSRFWTEEQIQSIKKVKNGQHGLEIEFYDGLKAAEMLAKQLKMQPEEGDAAEVARQGADEALRRIFSVFDKTFPAPATVAIEDQTQH